MIKMNLTKEISRHHKIIVSTSGLISVLGGKWTTYRKIAEDNSSAKDYIDKYFLRYSGIKEFMDIIKILILMTHFMFMELTLNQ